MYQDPDKEELVAAKLVGRWRSGCPLALRPEKDDESLAGNWMGNNAFGYVHDASGAACPLGSHIRRMNPRDGRIGDTLVRTHRIVRRGLPYGPWLPPGAPDDGKKRGVAFMAINASIRYQFEFLQREWINNGEFTGLSKADVDPFAGEPRNGSRFQILLPNGTPRNIFNLPAFVTLRGGGYYFIPSIKRLTVHRGTDIMTTSTLGASQSFLGDVATIEQQTPVPSPSDPAFAAAAKARGAAVSQVISHWLTTKPHDMLQELLDQPSDTMPIFKPAIGPVVVMRHPHVVTCLQRTALFTVDPYAAEMARATDDITKNPHALSHFMLGTDRDELYRLDDVILRRVVSRDDEAVLAALTRNEAERWTANARAAGHGEIDVVTTLATFVPLRIVTDYLGVPFHETGQPSQMPGFHGGDSFPLADSLQRSSRSRRSSTGSCRRQRICSRGSRTRSATPSTTSIRPSRSSPRFGTEAW